RVTAAGETRSVSAAPAVTGGAAPNQRAATSGPAWPQPQGKRSRLRGRSARGTVPTVVSAGSAERAGAPVGTTVIAAPARSAVRTARRAARARRGAPPPASTAGAGPTTAWAVCRAVAGTAWTFRWTSTTAARAATRAPTGRAATRSRSASGDVPAATGR